MRKERSSRDLFEVDGETPFGTRKESTGRSASVQKKQWGSFEKKVSLMPGLDGRGPMGMGSMTGGGRGWCNPYVAGIRPIMMGYPHFQPYGGWDPYGFSVYPEVPYIPGFAIPPYLPFGLRIGRRGWWNFPSPQEETRFLKDEAQILRKELKEIETRIREKERTMSCGDLTTLD